jgi:hypothetical protein
MANLVLENALRACEFEVQQRHAQNAIKRCFALLQDLAEETSEVNRSLTEEQNTVDVQAAFSRLASVLTSLFIDPAVEISQQDFNRLAQFQVEISSAFHLSGFGNADHILDSLTQRATTTGQPHLTFESKSDTRKFLLCCSVYSNRTSAFLKLVKADPTACHATLLRGLSSYLTCDPADEQTRQQLAAAVPLLENVTPRSSALLALNYAWAYSSYSTSKNRHDIKIVLNRMLINLMSATGIEVPKLNAPTEKKERPRLLLMCDVLADDHVMDRYFEAYLSQLTQRFEVVAVLAEHDYRRSTPPEWCDDVVTFPGQQPLGKIVQLVCSLQPDIIYYPCLGMRQWTIMLCNLRLAPLQIASLGHPATSHSPEIDAMVVGNDLLGSHDCFSETVLKLETPGSLYSLEGESWPARRAPSSEDQPVKVAVCANLIKLTSTFVAVCQKIVGAVNGPVEFHFFPNVVGMKWQIARKQLGKLLPDCSLVIHARTDRQTYRDNLHACDMYLSPIPFGGENSTLDALLAGLPVVTLQADEPSSRLDARVLRALDLPDWLIAATEEEYVTAACRLIENRPLLNEVRQQIAQTDIVQVFAEERKTYATDFVDRVAEYYESQNV